MPKNRVRFFAKDAACPLSSLSFHDDFEGGAALRNIPSFAAVALMLAFAPLPQLIRRMPNPKLSICRASRLGAPPQDFEFWRAGEAEPDYWTVVHEAASDGSVSVQRSGREP